MHRVRESIKESDNVYLAINIIEEIKTYRHTHIYTQYNTCTHTIVKGKKMVH